GRRFVGEHACPVALAAVDSAVVQATARARLENGLCDLDTQQVVLERLEAAEVRREYLERALDRRVDRDLCPHGCLLRLSVHWISCGCLNGRSCGPSGLCSRTARVRT